jgi:hypothetical protein
MRDHDRLFGVCWINLFLRSVAKVHTGGRNYWKFWHITFDIEAPGCPYCDNFPIGRRRAAPSSVIFNIVTATSLDQDNHKWRDDERPAQMGRIKLFHFENGIYVALMNGSFDP